MLIFVFWNTFTIIINKSWLKISSPALSVQALVSGPPLAWYPLLVSYTQFLIQWSAAAMCLCTPLWVKVGKKSLFSVPPDKYTQWRINKRHVKYKIAGENLICGISCAPTWTLLLVLPLWLLWLLLTSFASFLLRAVSQQWLEPPALLWASSPVGPLPVCPFALPAQHYEAYKSKSTEYSHM